MFTFLLISRDGSIPVFVFSSSPNVHSARREAAALLDLSSERSSVEVWNERERLCVVERHERGRTLARAARPGRPQELGIDGPR